MIIYDKNGRLLLDIEVDDTSVRYKVIKGENSLTLKFSLAEHMELPLGAFCEFKNERYTLMQPEDFTMHHRRSFEYSVIMYSEDAKAKRYMFVNPVDGRLKFSLTAKPNEHLQMFVDNLNSRDSGWSVGECPDQVEIVLSYNHTTCHDALVQLANELELDYWFDGKQVNLGKLELYKDNPLPLSYGGDGKGLRPNIKRTNYTEALPVEILYVQGTEVNIDPSKYGSVEMHLPKSQTLGYDGHHFDNENGFNPSDARYYKTDDKGYYISRADKDVNNFSEDSLDCTEIEPTKEETVSSVVVVDEEKHFYDILFDSNVDYGKYVIEGEKATIIFQSGMLAGKEFDLATDKNGNLICKKDENDHWRVEIVPQQIDGITMPDEESHYIPKGGEDGDKFKVFGIQLPDEFISDNETKTGAEWEMFRYAVKHFYNNEDVQYTISGELDEIYAKKNWVNIEGRLKLGSYVSFTDKSFQEDPLLIRITGIKEYVNRPHSPFLEISNAAIAGSLVGSINRVENQEAYTEEKIKDARRFTKRRFADAQRAIKLLEAAFGEGFDPSLKPVTIQTMMMLVGDESLQYSFVQSVGSDKEVPHREYFDIETKTFKCDAGVIKHYTLDVNEIRSKFDQKYHYWTMPEFESAVLDDASKEYYVYAVVNSEEDVDNDFKLEDAPIGIKDRLESEKRYYLLLGLLLKESEGSRDFMPLYGFTQILPGQITTDVIRSADGECYFDLKGNEIGGTIRFKGGSYGELNLGGQNLLRNSGFTGDYISEPLVDNTVMEAAKKLYSDPLDHWHTAGEVSVIDLEKAASGKAVTIAQNEERSGHLSQNLNSNTILGERYVISFYAMGEGTMTLRCGGVSQTVELTDKWNKSVLPFKVTTPSSEFAIEVNGSATIYDLQLERGTIATSWSPSYLDNNSDRTYWQAMKYLQDALAGSTIIDGGLILTNLIQVGEYSNQTEFVPKAGMNGLHYDDNSPAFWAGGGIQKAIDLINAFKDNPNAKLTDEQWASMAKFALTHGGRAILNEGIFRGTIYAQNGVFGGRLQLGFQRISGTHTLTINDSSSIWLQGEGYGSLLILTDDDAFDGWQLNVFAYPVSKMDGLPSVKGRILCPKKTTDDAALYRAETIHLPKGGFLQFTYSKITSEWILLNDAAQDIIYTEYTK